MHTGHLLERVGDRRRGCEFIGLPQVLDNHYPADAIISVVLDNHSSRNAKVTMASLVKRPGRFEEVHTPPRSPNCGHCPFLMATLRLFLARLEPGLISNAF